MAMDKQTERKEKAANNSKMCWNDFISSRVELALEQISRNPKYIELCGYQEEKTIDSILEKLDKEDRIVIRRYYENDTAKRGYELDEAYRQGIKDGIQYLLCLDVLQVKEWMGE